MHTHRGSNPGVEEGNKSLPSLGHDLSVILRTVIELLESELRENLSIKLP